MTEVVETGRNRHGNGLDRRRPRRFSATAWRRFSFDRRQRYLSQLPGPPDTAQATRIDTMVRLEWSAYKAEAEGTLRGDREGREHRRLLDRIMADFEASLPKPAARSTLVEKLAKRAMAPQR